MNSLSKKHLTLLGLLLLMSVPCLNSWAGSYADSAHGDSATGVAGRATGFETGNCAHCHDQHASRVGTPSTPRNSLGFDVLNTLCTDCHDLGGPAGKDIKTLQDTKTHTHNSSSTSHKYGESRVDISGTKHASCVDCHNPHVAQAGLKVGTQSNLAPNVLLGATAVNPNWGTTWSSPASWTESTIDAGGTYDYEWQVCFKCHSSYNTQLTTWNASWTDAAKEFNPNNASYHPVVQLNPNRNTATAGSGSGQYGPVFVNGWTKNSTMQCSDCHTDESSARPNGPHGSDVSSMLVAPYDSGTGDATSSGDLCFKCHDYAAYAQCGTGSYGNCGELGPYKTGFSSSIVTSKTTKTYNLHVYHVADKGVSCTGCHLLRLHGAKAGASGGPANIDRGLLLWDADQTDANYRGEMTENGTTKTFYQQITTWQNSGGWTSDSQCDYNQTTSHRP